MPFKVNQDLRDLVQTATSEITGVSINGQPLSDVIAQASFDGQNNLNLIIPQGTDLSSYQAKQSILWSNLIWRIGKDILKTTTFKTPFGRFIQQMKTGGDIAEVFINLKKVIDRNTLSNSDLFKNYTDDIKSAYHRINKQWVIPTTYREEEIRKNVTNWETLTSYIGSIVANLPNSLEWQIQEHFKHMLFDYARNGIIESVKHTPDTFIPELNALIDDFRTEPNSRYTPYNNTIDAPESKAMTLCKGTPVLVTFNDMIRHEEYMNALALNFGRQFQSGNDNQDFAKNLIVLNRKDFPNKYSDDYVINPAFAENDYISNSSISAFLLDEESIMLITQLSLQLSFLNIISLNVMECLHCDLYMGLSAFGKSAVMVEE